MNPTITAHESLPPVGFHGLALVGCQGNRILYFSLSAPALVLN
jgi:hypothetical protein